MPRSYKGTFRKILRKVSRPCFLGVSDLRENFPEGSPAKINSTPDGARPWFPASIYSGDVQAGRHY